MKYKFGFFILFPLSMIQLALALEPSAHTVTNEISCKSNKYCVIIFQPGEIVSSLDEYNHKESEIRIKEMNSPTGSLYNVILKGSNPYDLVIITNRATYNFDVNFQANGSRTFITKPENKALSAQPQPNNLSTVAA